MADSVKVHQTVIKKYANRRLYHTGTSTYVTLEDLATMVQNGEDFVVYDARTSEDITRSVLTQIIFEQENKAGADNLLPVAFLRQLIRFYGDSMRTMVPSFLEFSMANFARDQEGLREKFGTGGFGTGFGPAAFQNALEQQVRTNMSFFGDAMKMFTGLSAGATPGAAPPVPPKPANPPAAATSSGELDELKRQMLAMQERLEALAKK
ncbi:polyhydroxyalkanoate synthesis repressor PhaR [Methylobacterium hispanicum]|uniref:polyhydroxyalkanoate synthesis repressor PhaR n=1 Tax=Methylobacterium hispanicum TaxID=270350 RepID=UPI002F2BB556